MQNQARANLLKVNNENGWAICKIQYVQSSDVFISKFEQISQIVSWIG